MSIGAGLTAAADRAGARDRSLAISQAIAITAPIARTRLAIRRARHAPNTPSGPISTKASTAAAPTATTLTDRGEPAGFNAEQRLADHFRDVVEYAGDREELQTRGGGEVGR